MVEVAPEISLKVFPPSVLTCHCTVSVPLGLRLAAVKVAVLPATTIWLAARGDGVDRQRGGGGGKRTGGVREDGAVFIAVFGAVGGEAVGGRGCARDVGEGRAAVGAHLPLHRVRAAGVGRCGGERSALAGVDRLVNRLRGDGIDRQRRGIARDRAGHVGEDGLILVAAFGGGRREAVG